MSFMSPLVSIIIPVYNTAAYLRRCLDSVCNQTLANIEIICINDGSSDNSLDVLCEYAERDSRVKVFSIEHAGPGKARNLAIEHCKGSWITGLDSDDYLEPDACAYVTSHAEDDVDVIQYGFKVKLDNCNESLSTCLMRGKHAVTPKVLISHSCEFCGKLWRKSFIDKHECRFPEGVWYEDWFFYWAYLPYAKRVLYLSECKYVIVRRNSSIMGMTRNQTERVLDHVRVLGKLLDFRVNHPLSESYKGLNLANFVQCIRFIDTHLPKEDLCHANEMFREYSQHPLMKPFRIWFKAYEGSNEKTKCLIKFKPAEILIGVAKHFPLRIGIEGGYVVFRLFGKRFFRYTL